MFVTSPYRPNNGVTTVTGRRRTFTANGFTSIAAALAANPAGTTTGLIAIEASTERQFMQSGVVAGGSLKNTPYYAYRSHIRSTTVSYKHVKQYRFTPSPLYEVHYKEGGVGYTGGSNTGLGDPRNQVRRKSTHGDWAAVANRAIMANCENRAKLECLDKARNQKLDMSESFVDIDKTVLMIARRTAQVVKAWRKARALDWYGALKELGIIKPGRTLKDRLKKVRDDTASGWLELSYGWIPLLMDIHAGVGLVNTGIQLPEFVFTAKRRVSTPLPFIHWEGGEAPNFWWDYSIKSTMVHDVQCKYRMRINNPTLAYLTAIGLDNPAYIAWVGTPFTFVIDWLVPVGDWLQSFTTPLGLTLVDGSLSKRTSGAIEMEGKSWGARSQAQPLVWESPPMKIGIDIVELDREIFTSFPTQLPYFRLPFSNPHRITSSIALLHQARRG